MAAKRVRKDVASLDTTEIELSRWCRSGSASSKRYVSCPEPNAAFTERMEAACKGLASPRRSTDAAAARCRARSWTRILLSGRGAISCSVSW
jgi:hypothetical protein